MEVKYNPNNIVMNTLTKIYQVMLLNILFIFFSLPLVTIGAASKALTGCIRDMIKGELNHEFKTFFSYYKSDMKKSIISFLLLAIGYIFVGINLIYMARTSFIIGIIQLPVLIQLLLTHVMLNFVLLEFDLEVKKSIKVAWIMGNKHVIKVIGTLGLSYLLLKLGLRMPVIITFFYMPLIAILQYYFCYPMIQTLKGDQS